MSGTNAELIAEMQAAITELEAVQSLPPLVVKFRAPDDDDMYAWFERAEMKLAIFHRTLDAQLSILRGEVNFCKINSYSPSNSKLDLARAINGNSK